uniref:ATP synthase complex subunit 8 n=1 Tax=Pachybrachis sp. ReAss_5 TaxID=1934909 RepID=A0A3G1GPS4_9CUCU|nr:ATP synthase F0 subunit 8 [Pachybrachis sp. ReAss_5]
MPQMAPINWLSLFMTFIIALLIFSAMNYFATIYTPETSTKSKNDLSISWKW